MTNTEKYLKEGIDINKFAYELTAKISRWDELSYYSSGIEEDILEFFNEQVKPTLTEDERVILRNMQNNWKYIGRYEYDDTWAFSEMLYISTAKTKKSKFEVVGLELSQYNHLFQFIKERRRIFY